MAFFIDVSLGARDVAVALRAEGEQVEIHLDHFASDAPDTEWLEAAGQRGWAVLTKDRRIRSRQIERFAVARARLAVFILASGNLTGAEMSSAFRVALPRMKALCAGEPTPFIAKVLRDGRVEVWRDHTELLAELPRR